MSKLEFRTLTEAAEIDFFLECFKRFVKVKLPESYAQCGRVVGAFKKNELVGGYMLITKGPFRSLAFVPDAVKENLQLDGMDFMEVNGLWIHERYRRSMESIVLWMQMRKDVLASKSTHVLLFYNAKAKGLAELYEKALRPQVIYRGAPTPNPIAQMSYDEVTISIVSRLDIRIGLYRGLALRMTKRVATTARAA